MGFLIIAPFAILAGWSISAIYGWLWRGAYGSKWWNSFMLLSCVGLALGVWFAFFLEYNVANKRVHGFPIPNGIFNREKPTDAWIRGAMPISIRVGGIATDFLCGIALCLAPIAAAAFLRENRRGHDSAHNTRRDGSKCFMIVAGEASGDILATELVTELRACLAQGGSDAADQPPIFFGAGGPRMAAAGVELAFDLTQHSLIGLPGPRSYLKFRERLDQLVELACDREPDGIICVDFQLFNSAFASAVKRRVLARRDSSDGWNPKIIKYISPQVWASREKRAYKIARDFDLVLSIIPFEKEWYAARVPNLRVEFIGHPLVDRYGDIKRLPSAAGLPASPNILLLPGSRKGELERHWPVMFAAWQKIQAALPAARAKAIVPSERLAAMARSLAAQSVGIQVGGLAEALPKADLAISKTGTITLECALFGVPAVTMYIASGLTYQIGRHIVKVRWASMPNLIMNEEVFPEFIQHAATPENISRAALEILQNKARRETVRAQMAEVVAKLGSPGASRRAAVAILAVTR